MKNFVMYLLHETSVYMCSYEICYDVLIYFMYIFLVAIVDFFFFSLTLSYYIVTVRGLTTALESEIINTFFFSSSTLSALALIP